MHRYVFKRLILMIPMIIGISFILFIIMHLAPGDPASIKYGLNPEVSGSARDAFSKMYDLDKPILQQYLLWSKRMVTLDFGTSFIDDRPVIDKIFERLPATLLLQFVSIFFIFLFAVPIGVISAIKHNSLFDKGATIFVFVGYAMPTFWFALLLILFFGVKLSMFPISGMSPWYVEYLNNFEKLKDLLWHLVLPVTATIFGSLAALSRYARSSVLEVAKERYVLTARARGIPERRIAVNYILRNALLPIITIFGMTIPALISGSFIFETIFSWPGMGRLGYEAIMNYDYPMVMGVGVIATFLTLLGIFISDILYAVCDPRIRVGNRNA